LTADSIKRKLKKQWHELSKTDAGMTKLIEEIDARKVVVDGVAAKDPPLPCPVCGKLNSAKRRFCMYCGKVMPGNPFAR